MFLKRRRNRVGLLCAAMTAPFLILIGCSKNASTPETTGTGNVASAGQPPTVFMSACARCHSIGASGEGGGRRKIDLSHEGTDPTHTPQWIAEFIRNPQSKKPGIRMPAFAGQLSDADIQTLSAYLAALK